MIQKSAVLLLFSALALDAQTAGRMDWKKVNAETLDYFSKLIQIDTSNPPGN